MVLNPQLIGSAIDLSICGRSSVMKIRSDRSLFILQGDRPFYSIKTESRPKAGIRMGCVVPERTARYVE